MRLSLYTYTQDMPAHHGRSHKGVPDTAVIIFKLVLNSASSALSDTSLPPVVHVLFRHMALRVFHGKGQSAGHYQRMYMHVCV